MNELEHAKSMLVMAEKDFKAIKGMSDVHIFADEIFGFHVQQVMVSDFSQF